MGCYQNCGCAPGKCAAREELVRVPNPDAARRAADRTKEKLAYVARHGTERHDRPAYRRHEFPRKP